MTESELVPAVIGLIGAFLGAIGALGGSWLQNRHDANQRERERLMSFRRDVYLNAAEGLAGYTRYLAGIINPDLTLNSNSANLDSNPGWETKVHTVAKLSTVEALSRATSEFSKIIYQVAPARYELDELQKRLSHERARLLRIETYHTALGEAVLSRSSQAGNPVHSRWIDFQLAQIPACQAAITASQACVADLDQQISRARISLIQRMAEPIAQHRLLVSKAILEIRREIEASDIDNAYLSIVESSNAESVAALRDFTHSFETSDESKNAT